MFGLSSSGFMPKRLDDIQAELDTLFRQTFGGGIKTSTDSKFGKLIGIMADRESSLWELAEAVYNSQYPDSANDVSLDRVGEYTAITRNAARPSTVTVYLAGTNSTAIPVGTLFAVQDAGDQFTTLAAVTLSGSNLSVASLTFSGNVVTATATAHGLTVGRRVFINNAIQPEYNGLQTVEVVPTVDTFTYTIIGTPATPATGTITADPATAVNAESVETGPITALAGTLNQIVNNVSGLSRVENQDDALKGQALEKDAEFRIRRVEALKGLGAARLEAIRGALLQLPNVTAATVFENDTSAYDSEGRPPHSIECLVIGGLDTDILYAAWNKKAAGIKVVGLISGAVMDSQGIAHTSKFSRPTPVNLFLELDLTVNADFPGIADVETRILDYGTGLTIGEDVIVYPYLISSFKDVPGILDVAVRIGTTANPTLDDNIVIPATQIADFDSARITITLL